MTAIVTSVVTMLIITTGGTQYVGEYPDMDSCVTAARLTFVVDGSVEVPDIGYRFLCVPGADWAEELAPDGQP